MKYKNYLIIIGLVLLDFLTKLYFNTRSLYLGKYFLLMPTTNTGIAFGLFKGENLFFIILTLILIGVVIYFYKYKEYNTWLNLILAGAIGNLVSRILYGYVIDFIQIWRWPVFNLADCFIVVGVLYLMIKTWK